MKPDQYHDALGRNADEAYEQWRDEMMNPLSAAEVDYGGDESDPLPRLLTTQELLKRICELTQRP